MLSKEPRRRLSGVDPIDSDGCDGAGDDDRGWWRTGRLGVLAVGPSTAFEGIGVAGLLPLDADHLVEGERLGDRVVIRRRVGADLFELPDIVRLRFARSHQRPDILDSVLLDVHEPGADRRHQPLVKRVAYMSHSRSWLSNLN